MHVTDEQKIKEINKKLYEEGFQTLVVHMVHDDFCVLYTEEERNNTIKRDRINKIIQEELIINSI